jgi:hypothetical protein
MIVSEEDAGRIFFILKTGIYQHMAIAVAKLIMLKFCRYYYIKD